jgi:hypothetical protein
MLRREEPRHFSNTHLEIPMQSASSTTTLTGRDFRACMTRGSLSSNRSGVVISIGAFSGKLPLFSFVMNTASKPVPRNAISCSRPRHRSGDTIKTSSPGPLFALPPKNAGKGKTHVLPDPVGDTQTTLRFPGCIHASKRSFCPLRSAEPHFSCATFILFGIASFLAVSRGWHCICFHRDGGRPAATAGF